MAGSARTKKSGVGTNGSGLRRLVIVESPAKARKIASYLGKDYVVQSSKGHIRDLPRKAAEVPAKYKGESWSSLGVNVDNDFEPIYIVTPDKRATVAELKEALKNVDELYLATDGDREGEAIAWHLLETLKPTIPVRRMVFHEITEPAILAAAQNPRDLDTDLVEAYETRRILDRLYGYEVSPVLWKKVMPKLSAGRVQSVETRIVVQRERERMRFVSASYWDVAAILDAGEDATPRTFGARLTAVDGTRLATGRDFGSNGELRANTDVRNLGEAEARRLVDALATARLSVASVEEKPYTRKPYPPFMTSTLQQEAGRKLRFSASRAMSVAQRLYENGYITYMRTDSTTLSETALAAARAQAIQLYGSQYVPAQPRRYDRKVKNAQEAHEAIRPAGEVFRTPGEVAAELESDEFRLYELIWQRTIASQMADARGTTMSVRITGTASSGEECTFSGVGPHHHVPRLPQGLRGVGRLGGGRRGGQRGTSAAAPDQGPGTHRDRPDRGRPQHQPAPPLHRGQPDQDAGGARHRQAVHLRVHDQHHPGTRLRVEEGLGAGPVMGRVLRGGPARTALRPAGGLRLHRGHGGRAGADRGR